MSGPTYSYYLPSVIRYGVPFTRAAFVHLTQSFAIPSVTYVDSDRRYTRFFSDPSVLRLVKQRRQYAEEPEVLFHAQDYTKPMDARSESFDLLLSQWAGPISQACKPYLKKGGVLVANDSHGDATLANLDGEYELVAVVNRRAQKHRLSEEALDTYFVPKSGGCVTRELVERTGIGPSYTRSPAAYVFRRVGASS